MLLFLHSLSHLLVDAACAATLFGPVRELGDLTSLLLLYNTLAFSAQCLAGLAADRIRRLRGWAAGAMLCVAAGFLLPLPAQAPVGKAGVFRQDPMFQGFSFLSRQHRLRLLFVEIALLVFF